MRTRLGILALALGLAGAPASPPAAGLDAARASDIGPFRGLGAWVDIYDPNAWKDPAAVIEDLAAHGVRTLYLETANYHRRGPITFPKAAGRFIDLAHARGIEVVAWYLPGFIDMKLDWRRTRAALRFRSPAGERFDGFALDIEATRVKDVAKRTRRMLALSRRIRQAVGPEYPLGAIHFSPRGLELSPSTWPGFPYAKVADIYDVLMPMAYYSYRAHGPAAVRAYLARSIDIIRAATPGRSVPIHAIGGLADASSEAEGLAFARTVREYGLAGASIYDHSIMDDGDWRAFAEIQPNPKQPEALPFRPWSHLGAYGNLPDGDQSHPAELVFRIGKVSGARELAFEAFDVQAEEIDVLLNWKPIGILTPGAAGDWTERRTLAMPDELLSSARPNVIAFVSRARFPDWSTWGVRRVTVNGAPLPISDTAPRGALPGAGTRWADRVDYELTATGAPQSVTVRGFDISEKEVVVLLDGSPIGFLDPTPAGDWGPAQVFVLSPPAGTHRLTFDSAQNPPERLPWGVRVDAVA